MMNRTLVSCKNPRWGNEKKTFVICSVKFEEIVGEVEFHASPMDPETHGRELYDRIVSEEFGAIGVFTPIPPKFQVAPAAVGTRKV